MSKVKNILAHGALVLSGTVVAFLIAELVVRDYSQGFTNLILVQNGGNLVQHHFKGLYQHDPLTGWVPRPQASGNKWDVEIRIQEDGIRSNGRPFNGDPRPLFLAVGDSFTFGDEVADHETWPAVLEAISHKRVLNAGVSSYGLDQMILRAENLIAKYRPDQLLVSLVHADILRLGQTFRHGVPKPYFTIRNGALSLHHHPVPIQSRTHLDPFRAVFGYSHLAHGLMGSYFPKYWRRNTMWDIRGIDSPLTDIARLLIDRIHGVARKERIDLVFVIQGWMGSTYELSFLNPVLEHLERSNLPSVDLLSRLLSLKENEPETHEGFFTKSINRHMSPPGNAWVAMQIKEHLSVSP